MLLPPTGPAAGGLSAAPTREAGSSGGRRPSGTVPRMRKMYSSAADMGGGRPDSAGLADPVTLHAVPDNPLTPRDSPLIAVWNSLTQRDAALIAV